MTAKKKSPDFYCSNALVDVLDVVDAIFDVNAAAVDFVYVSAAVKCCSCCCC